MPGTTLRRRLFFQFLANYFFETSPKKVFFRAWHLKVRNLGLPQDENRIPRFALLDVDHFPARGPGGQRDRRQVLGASRGGEAAETVVLR